jgi:hypothetical protein
MERCENSLYLSKERVRERFLGFRDRPSVPAGSLESRATSPAVRVARVDLLLVKGEVRKAPHHELRYAKLSDTRRGEKSSGAR